MLVTWLGNSGQADPQAGGAAPAVAGDNATAEANAAAASAPETAKVERTEQATLPSQLKPSPALAEFIKLVQAGMSDEVLLAYITKSKETFNPNPDEIVYLNDLGVSEAVMTALIRKAGPEAPAQPAAREAAVVVTTPEAPVVEVPPPAPVEQVNVSYFYSNLSPYGNWVEIADYGWCWQPTVAVVNVNWRPYYDRGCWIYSDFGWYWQSNYSWGWAPFHYGRWFHHQSCGWVWTPDVVWGPAWVSWRYAPAHCGWAPLPPAARYQSGVGFTQVSGSVGIGFEFGLSYNHYTFVPTQRFCDRYPYRYGVPRAQVQTVYNQTTVINNYIHGNNNTVINEGIGRDRIVAVTKTQIPKVTIRDLPAQSARTIKPDRLEKDGGKLVLYRPPLIKPNEDHRTAARKGNQATVAAPLQHGATALQAGSENPAPAGTKPAAAATDSKRKPKSPATAPASPSSPPATVTTSPTAKETTTSLTTSATPRTTIRPPARKSKISDERLAEFIAESKAKQGNNGKHTAPTAKTPVGKAVTPLAAPSEPQTQNNPPAPAQQKYSAPQEKKTPAANPRPTPSQRAIISSQPESRAAPSLSAAPYNSNRQPAGRSPAPQNPQPAVKPAPASAAPVTRPEPVSVQSPRPQPNAAPPTPPPNAQVNSSQENPGRSQSAPAARNDPGRPSKANKDN